MKEYIRFSALDRIAVCPASWIESRDKPSVGSEAARFGTAGHEVYEAKALGLTPDIQSIAVRHGVGERAEELVEIIRKADFTPIGEPEVAVAIEFGESTPAIKGTADLVQVDHRTVVDYKFSQLRGNMPKVDERVQVPGYSWAGAAGRGWNAVTAQVFNPLMAGKGWSSREYNSEEIEAGIGLLKNLAESAEAQANLPIDKRDYSPSEHCGFCPGRTSCPAIKVQLQAVATIGKTELSVDVENLPALVQFAKDLTRRAEAVIKHAKSTLELTGNIVGPDGLSLVLTRQMRRPSVSAKAVMEWLERHGHADLLLELKAELEDRPKIEVAVMNVKKAKEIAANV